MASISVAVPAVEEVSVSEAQVIYQDLSQQINTAKATITSLLESFNISYNKMMKQGQSIEVLQNRQSQLQKYVSDIRQQIKNNEKIIKPSGKGGADIAPKGFVKKINQITDLKTRKETALSDIRNHIYGKAADVKNQQEYKKNAVKVMRMVYQLRELFTGKEEKIIVAYKGNGNQIYTTSVSMVSFLKHADTVNNLSLNLQSIDNFTGADPFQLSFKTSVISQLQSIAQNDEKQLSNQVSNPFSFTNTLDNNIISTKNDFLNFLAKHEVIALRTDKKRGYEVLKKGLAGYILENMLANQFGNNVDLFKRGNDVWYTGGDFTDQSTGTEYSAKSFLLGSPTLTKMSTIQTVLWEMYNMLSVQDPVQIQEKLKNLLKIGAEKADQTLNADINEILNIITSG